eukprot:gnl/MRDRNA2_/MRDRNA2_110221_c0_seq1.p1 gnl/MRDRNA2_/MRDRNA2_110221_c0~~gnl/MRDRNA2_/MRDRNA2_110221_c0_seq1.p1  ORF type:complete len:304 (+),score=96.12 gnl/MRDRNA2_/MRDRNA2_110221_c0_seq1:95-913(+)
MPGEVDGYDSEDFEEDSQQKCIKTDMAMDSHAKDAAIAAENSDAYDSEGFEDMDSRSKPSHISIVGDSQAFDGYDSDDFEENDTVKENSKLGSGGAAGAATIPDEHQSDRSDSQHNQSKKESDHVGSVAESPDGYGSDSFEESDSVVEKNSRKGERKSSGANSESKAASLNPGLPNCKASHAVRKVSDSDDFEAMAKKFIAGGAPIESDSDSEDEEHSGGKNVPPANSAAGLKSSNSAMAWTPVTSGQKYGSGNNNEDHFDSVEESIEDPFD